MSTANEYLTSHKQIAYPFQENATGLARGTEPAWASGGFASDVLVDGMLVVPPDLLGTESGQSTMVISLSSVTRSGNSFLFTFTNELAVTIFTFTVTLANLAGAGYYVAAGSYASASGDVHGEFVLSKLEALTFLSTASSGATAFSGLPMETSAVDIRAKRILSFELYNDGLAQPPEAIGQIDGDVRLVEGYNCGIFNVEDADNDTHEVELHAVPGMGLGRLPCSEAEHTLTTPFMRLRPDKAGNVQIIPGTEGCYEIVPHPSIETFEIQGSCDACCTCDDFAEVLAAIQALAQTELGIMTTLDDARTVYEDAVTYWNSTTSLFVTEPTIRVNGMKGPESLARQLRSPNWSRLVINITNNWADDATLTGLTVNYTTPATTEIFVEGNWEYTDEGGQFDTLTWVPGVGVPALETRQGLSITLLVAFDLDDYIAAGSYVVEVEATLTHAGGGPATLTETIQFN